MVQDIKLNNPLSDSNPALPGNRANYLENQFNPREAVLPEPDTGSILIIGSATDGPVGEPIAVSEIGGVKRAVEVFGGLTKKIEYEERGRRRFVEVPNNNNLTRALMEAVNNGSDNIRLLRVDGREARTELYANDPNTSVRQPLSDLSGSNLMNGNIRFMADIKLDGDRFLNVVKIEEIDEEGNIVQTKEGSTGYTEAIEGFNDNMEIHIPADMYTPGNTLKVHYNSGKRTYIEVAHTDPDGLLTQDPSNNRYFTSAHENWSDRPEHTMNVFLVEKGAGENGDDVAHSIPWMIDGKYLYRPGLGDPNVDELTQFPSSEEFRQGGIRFTSAFDKHVAEGLYPSLSQTNLVVMVDYTRYESTAAKSELEVDIKGQKKNRALRSTPELDTLEVFYEFDEEKTELELDKDFKLILGESSDERDFIVIENGAAPIGAKLYAVYTAVGASDEMGTLKVSGLYPGKRYGSLRVPEDKGSIEGVSVTVEYGETRDGRIDEENRVIRFKKPTDKRLSSVDTELVYSSSTLKEVKTLSQLANFINNDARNNIVKLTPGEGSSNILFKTLAVTDHEINPNTELPEYKDIYLGYKLDENTGKYELYEDENQELHSPERFPWLGHDGHYDNTSLESMLRYYNRLGGVYGWDYERSTTEPVLLEPGIYTDLENYPVEQVRLVDVYANTAIGRVTEEGDIELDKDRNFATQLAQFCATLSARTDAAIGVIDMVPLAKTNLRDVQEAIDLFAGERVPTEAMAEEYVSRGVNPYYKNEHYLYHPVTGEEIFNDNSQPIDIGFFISVVFGPEVALTEARLGGYISTGGTMLSSLISQLPINVSTTNHDFGILGLRYTLSSPQHEQLLRHGYVTFDRETELNGRRRFFVKDGVTAGTPNSDYRLLSTIRITNAAVHAVKEATKGYIGKSGGIAQDNSISTDVKSTLDNLKTQGILTDYRFSIEISNQERLVKNVFIDLEIVPVFEVRRIRTTVTVTDSL